MMTRKKKVSQRKKKFRIHPFLLFFLLVLLAIPLILSLIDWFSERQILQFSSPNRLIFVQNNSTIMLLVGIPMALILCFLFFLEGKKKQGNLFVNRYILIGLGILVVGGLFIGNDFYSYGHFDKKGIKTRDGLFTKEIEHDWTSINSATVRYSVSHSPRSSNNINIYYDLHMANGRVFNLYHSPEFFTHILQVDQFVQGLGIPITRSGIYVDDDALFIEDFKGPGKLKDIDRLEVLKKLFK